MEHPVKKNGRFLSLEEMLLHLALRRLVKYQKVGRTGYTPEQLRAIRAERGVGRPPAVIRERRERGYYANMPNPC